MRNQLCILIDSHSLHRVLEDLHDGYTAEENVEALTKQVREKGDTIEGMGRRLRDLEAQLKSYAVNEERSVEKLRRALELCRPFVSTSYIVGERSMANRKPAMEALRDALASTEPIPF